MALIKLVFEIIKARLQCWWLVRIVGKSPYKAASYLNKKGGCFVVRIQHKLTHNIWSIELCKPEHGQFYEVLTKTVMFMSNELQIEIRSILQPKNCFLVIKGPTYLIYRKSKPRNIVVARSRNLQRIYSAAKKL